MHVPRDSFGPTPEKDFPWIQKENRYPRTREDFWRKKEKRRFERKRKVQLMALSTPDDQLLDWLRAGQALQRAILTGTRFSVSAPYGQAAEYHAPRWYGVPARGRVIRHDDLARYGLSVSFLTEPLECYDIEHPLRLENIHGDLRDWPWRFAQPRHRPWQYPEPRHWPWRWQFPELPQMVLRVGYAADPAQPDVSHAALADRLPPQCASHIQAVKRVQRTSSPRRTHVAERRWLWRPGPVRPADSPHFLMGHGHRRAFLF